MSSEKNPMTCTDYLNVLANRRYKLNDVFHANHYLYKNTPLFYIMMFYCSVGHYNSPLTRLNKILYLRLLLIRKHSLQSPFVWFKSCQFCLFHLIGHRTFTKRVRYLWLLCLHSSVWWWNCISQCYSCSFNCSPPLWG